MKFKKGDIITGYSDNGYVVTTEQALMIVLQEHGRMMKVQVLAHSESDDELLKTFSVRNTEYKFRPITVQEFFELHPTWFSISSYDMDQIILRYNTEEEKKPDDDWKLDENTRAELLTEMKELLEEYDYYPTEDGLNAILDEWYKNNRQLIELFQKSPNYNGKFQIVFSHDYDRKIDYYTIDLFRDWLTNECVTRKFRKEVQVGCFTHQELWNIINKLESILYVFNRNIKTVNGKTKDDYMKERHHFIELRRKLYLNNDDVYVAGNGIAYDKLMYEKYNLLYSIREVLSCCEGQFITVWQEDYLNANFPELKAKEGQRVSRAINKALKILGVDTEPDYNAEFAKFSDAINPKNIVRHTILSIHPVDYLTMSFGNSWASCHTIDKANKRKADSENHYTGCNSSGTMSYMLDGTSFVFYTVGKEYDGDKFELQDKINRCMFHYYDNQLVQGRVYPQSNDSGSSSLYTNIREIVQKIIADLLDEPNMWTLQRGTSACENVVFSYGTHYRDYENFSNCNVSTLKDGREWHDNVQVGHDPICPRCGNEHTGCSNIQCCTCLDEINNEAIEILDEDSNEESEWNW